MTDTKTASGICISPDGSLPAGNDLPDVTLIGAAVLDVLARPVTQEVFTEGSASVKETRLAFGGDALNEATVLSRLGKKVSLITRVGDDEAGAAILRQLRSLGISGKGISVIPGLRTAVNIVLVDEAGERYFLTDPESSLRTLEPADILPKLEGAGKICCLASMFVSERLPFPEVTKLFRFLKDSGRTVCMDVTKRKHGETISDLRALLSCVDILFANAEEASLLTGTADPAGSARMLREAGVRCAVVSGLANTRRLMLDLKAGKAHYDFVEVMACPGGCAGGGGQPISIDDEELYGVRGARLHALDKEATLRFSHENPQIQRLYREYLEKPLSPLAEKLLHTDHFAWNVTDCF